MTTVQILLTLHILAALVAVGATVSYFFWLRRAVLVPESRTFTLETIRLLEQRMVNACVHHSPAYWTWPDRSRVLGLVHSMVGAVDPALRRSHGPCRRPRTSTQRADCTGGRRRGRLRRLRLCPRTGSDANGGQGRGRDRARLSDGVQATTLGMSL